MTRFGLVTISLPSRRSISTSAKKLRGVAVSSGGCALPCLEGKRPATSRQDDELAGAIANAFFALPHGIRCRIWPEWTEAP